IWKSSSRKQLREGKAVGAPLPVDACWRNSLSVPGGVNLGLVHDLWRNQPGFAELNAIPRAKPMSWRCRQNTAVDKGPKPIHQVKVIVQIPPVETVFVVEAIIETNQVLPPVKRVVRLEGRDEGNRIRGAGRKRGEPTGQCRHRAVDLGNRFAVGCKRRVGIEIEAVAGNGS